MFDRVLDLLEKHRPEVSKAFFHYCRKQTLKALLKPDAEIYCTHTAHLNDDREILEGCECFLTYLQEKEDFDVSCIQMLRENIIENINRFDPRANDLPNVMPWTFSLSEVSDSPYQWRNYTDTINGGYCLAFDRELLERAIAALNIANTQDTLDFESRQVLVLLPCLYLGQDADLIENVFRATVMDFKQDFLEVKGSTPEHQATWCAGRQVLSAIFFVAGIIKREKFHHEREWRIIMHATEKIKANFEMTVGKPCLRTLLSAGLNGKISDMIVQVLQSPQGDSAQLTRYAQLLLQRMGLLLHVHASSLDRSVVNNYITQLVIPPRYEDYVVEQVASSSSNRIMTKEEFALNTRSPAI